MLCSTGLLLPDGPFLENLVRLRSSSRVRSPAINFRRTKFTVQQNNFFFFERRMRVENLIQLSTKYLTVENNRLYGIITVLLIFTACREDDNQKGLPCRTPLFIVAEKK